MKKILFSIVTLLLWAFVKAEVCMADDFVRGADISWVSEMEDKGVKWYDAAGTETDVFQLFSQLGCNVIRLRVWVSPADGYNNAADVLAKAKRAAAAGMDLMVDFHYSDTWADPAHQTVPAAWTGKTVDELSAAVEQHTTEVLNMLKEEGIRVKWVQVGNESTNGMLWPQGDITKGTAQGKNYARFFMAGSKAAKTVYPDCQVIVHVDRGQKKDVTEWSLDILKAGGADWDITGLSFYPSIDNWQSEEIACAGNVKNLISRYGKPVMLCETGFARENSSAEDFIVKLRHDLENTKQCLGIFYWEPEDYKGWNGGYGLGAFQDNGRPSAAIARLLNPYVAYLAAYMKGDDEHGLYYALATKDYLFDEINNGQRILTASGDDRLVRDPHLLRCPDGKFRMVATVSWTHRPFTLWESNDLVHWEHERLIDIAPKDASKTWAPELIYDEAGKQYMVYWTAEVGGDWNTACIYYATTCDFTTWSTPQPLYQQMENGRQAGILDANITKVGSQYVMLFRYNNAIHKAVADSCTGPYAYVGEVNNENVEGPFVWQLIDGTGYGYCFDYFGGSRGFGLLTSRDLHDWTLITNASIPYYNERVRFPKGIRHGSVIGITAKELQYMTEELGPE